MEQPIEKIIRVFPKDLKEGDEIIVGYKDNFNYKKIDFAKEDTLKFIHFLMYKTEVVECVILYDAETYYQEHEVAEDDFIEDVWEIITTFEDTDTDADRNFYQLESDDPIWKIEREKE